MDNRKSKLGFTVIELLIVMAIIVVIATVTLPVLTSFYRRTSVNTKTAEMIDTLSRARLYSMQGRFDTEWGVHFETKEWVLFRGGTYNPAAPENELHETGKGYEIVDINLNGGGSDLIFNRVKGDTEENGSITIQNIDATESETVGINEVGRINN